MEKIAPSGLPAPARDKILPFCLTAGIVAADQITKWLVVGNIPRRTVGAAFFGDFLRIIHARNPGIAFSLGRDLPDAVRGILFTVLPIVILAALAVYYFRSDEFTRLQRWAVAGIIGGGVGNLIDRVFRPEGVVDFIDVRFFGLFGLDRWPTFNVADSSVVVCGALLAASILAHRKDAHE